MSEYRRSDFIKRVSSIGWGTRESIQMLLGGIVSDLREEIIRDQFSDDELGTVVAFHDRAEELWRDAMGTNPPLDAGDMVARLRQLLDACDAPALAGFESRLRRGLRDAEAFLQSREG
ncbi:MAG: hypothetical protein ACE5HT_11865 [Gemmatimonadales bacterium]